MHALEKKVYSLLRENEVLSSGDVVVAGISGGPDSMALLHLLAASSRLFPFNITAVYIDHKLRPDETEAERNLVSEASMRLGIDYEVFEADVPGEAAKRKQSIEHTARELRYQAFFKIAGKHPAAVIAVGHTADDQVEELLLRLLRGSSRKAISGMRLQENRIIRPLLGFSKQELLSYLTDINIGFCIDSSNYESVYLRNRIRNELLPLLETEYDAGIRKALLKTAANLAEDEHLLTELVNDAWGLVVDDVKRENGEASLNRTRFIQCHPALQRRVVERLLWEIGSAARYEHILAVIRAAAKKQSGTELHLTRGLRVIVTRETLFFSHPKGKVSWRGSIKGDAKPGTIKGIK